MSPLSSSGWFSSLSNDRYSFWAVPCVLWWHLQDYYLKFLFHSPSFCCFSCLHQIFWTPPIPSDILTAIIECEWHKTATVFCDRDQNVAADACGSHSFKPHNWSEKKKKKSQSICSLTKNIRDAREAARSWHSGPCFLCVVCDRSENVPLRNTPRLLQLMTAGGSPVGAVWQHLLRY